MAVVNLTKENFEETIAKNEIVIVDFWAPWCGPCKAFGPTFEKESEAHPDAVFAKVNTDEERDLAAAFQIRSIPTLMAFREQIGVFAQPGALPATALAEVVEQVEALDMADVRKQIAERQGEPAQAAS